ncbi:MAG: AAA family ATPase [Chloroflexi bacterium]|nr:MAG: AAA family ATPase [Chloroflexota bacterium]MBL1193005.1 AAA family ATPase [Chloroflexota bacterium]NOH10298.1 AAA family ATPase [Chloroflexota bacterium]
MSKRQITDDLDALLGVLPQDLAQALKDHNHSDELLEVIIDLGRVPTARLTSGEVTLVEREVTREDIDHVVNQLGGFDEDNRGGLERTLHRIAAIRNRQGEVVGLTCRVGRAVYGTIDIIQDLIDGGKSLLLLGRPGVGKTTLLREAARILAESKRVVVVDTSNEIGGDGDVPHPAVGRARRMQVATPSLQHEVMIEAVENHNPEVIVIDEIGRELEAQAARTIAERGVQLIGTAHGNTLENLLINPTLSDLIGGIESVTLSDEEARRRGTQKTVLERRSPPTFDVLVEIQHRDQIAVHPDVSDAVDALLRATPLQPEVRRRTEEGGIAVETPAPVKATARRTAMSQVGGPRRNNGGNSEGGERRVSDQFIQAAERSSRRQAVEALKIYAYGVARNRLANAAKRLGVPIVITKDVSEADVLVTLRSHYRKRQRTVMNAEQRGMPVYVLRSNTVKQMEQFLSNLFELRLEEPAGRNEEQALEEAERAIAAVMNGERWVELPSASSYVRRIQHQMAQEAQLVSHSYGKEPNRRVRIFRE